MTRLDDVQAAYDNRDTASGNAVALCLPAVPGLVAIARVAEDALRPLGLDAKPRTELVLIREALSEALAEFEAGRDG